MNTGELILAKYAVTICLLLFSCTLAGQECLCEEQTETTICYISRSQYCLGNQGCQYTLDGEYMVGLNAKLNNPNNFGENGISNCPVRLRTLPTNPSVASIDNAGCDIIFTGNFPIGSDGNIDITATSVPNQTLDSIYSWSLECPSNLVIVTQVEAEPWGYISINANENPNTAFPNTSELSVFDGPFGTVSQFLQGGSFQGVFTQTPTTGSTVLAVDANFNTTIVLDGVSNDIVLGDIGIFCGGAAGSVSNDAGINNSNDILICNLFALGCQISSSEQRSEDIVNICQGETHILPDGEIVDFSGVFFDTLRTAQDCDSIIETYLRVVYNEPRLVAYDGCQDDGFEMLVGDVLYNENNIWGVETLKDQYGCDSIVELDFFYGRVDEASVYDELCLVDVFEFDDFLLSPPIDTTIVYQNEFNCDSSFRITIDAFPEPVFEHTEKVELVNGEDYQFNQTIGDYVSIEWFPSEGLSCSDCVNPFLSGSAEIDQYRITIEDVYGCNFSYFTSIVKICRPYLPNIFNPDDLLSDNGSFKPMSNCELENPEMRIFDRWGNLLYESRDLTIGWDGTYRGENLQSGVYTFILEYSEDNELVIESGTITLLR